MKEFLELGSWELFFRPRDEFRHPLVDRSALKSGRVPHSDVFASGEDSVPLSPTKEWVLTLLLLALLPLALPWWIGLLRWPRCDSFHLGVSCAGLTRMVAS